MNANNRFMRVLAEHRDASRPTTPMDWVSQENSLALFRWLGRGDWPAEVTKYCSSTVAESIIGAGHIWLCDVRNMDDESEFTFAKNLLDSELDALKSEQSAPDVLIDALQKSANEFASSRDQSTFNSRFILAMCFSRLKDDAAMWDRYGDVGQGMAIHFNLHRLATAISAASNLALNASRFDMGVVEVCYPNDQCNCLKAIVSEVLIAYENTRDQDERDLVRTLLHARILEYLVGHKHPSFASEKEFRIYSRTPCERTWAGSDNIYEHDNGSRRSIHSIVPLPHLAIQESPEKFWRVLVPGVTYGPSSSEESRVRLTNAMEARGLGSRTKKSAYPLRSY